MALVLYLVAVVLLGVETFRTRSFGWAGLTVAVFTFGILGRLD